MLLRATFSRPPRCILANLSNGESMECLFNPTELSEKLQVNYNRLQVPGLSHQPLQFQNTSNRQFSGVEFYLDRFFAAEQPGDPDILEFRYFLRAFTVPPEGTEGVVNTAPPRVLFIWPEVLTVEAVIGSVEFRYKQLAVDGTVLVYSADVTFEEILDERVTSEELREGED
ncbi:MAG: peptidoglycan-binding protein [Polyangiaceae bacterium]